MWRVKIECYRGTGRPSSISAISGIGASPSEDGTTWHEGAYDTEREAQMAAAAIWRDRTIVDSDGLTQWAPER